VGERLCRVDRGRFHAEIAERRRKPGDSFRVRRNQLGLVTIRQTIYFVHGEQWRTGARRERRHTALEVNIGVSDPAKQGLDKVVHALSGLVCQLGEASLHG
jgi:hypothetical protein